MRTSTVTDRPPAGQRSATTTALATRTATGIPEVLSPYIGPFGLDRPQLDLIKRTCCPPGTTDDQMALYFHMCHQRGVHPLDRMIILTLFTDKEAQQGGGKKPVFLTTIDYFRSQAEASDALAGISEPQYGPTIREGSIEVPSWAKVIAYRSVNGRRRPFVGKALWREFYPGPSERGALWRNKPHHMLAKCAEAQALRKAFPRRLAKLYVREEFAPLPDVTDGDNSVIVPPAATKKKRGRKADAEPEPTPAEVIDAEAADGAADHYTVAEIQPGKTRREPRKEIWKVTCRNGRDEERVVYTLQPAYHQTFRELQQAGRVFEMTWHDAGGFDEVDTIEPL